MFRCLRFLFPVWACLAGSSLGATPPSWSVQQPMYEINPEMYAPQGSFQAIERDLPRLQRLGVGILWLMPIYPRGQERGFNSPYCIRDHTGIYPPYGTAADLKALVRAAHALGLHVILDWVGNHSSWDNPLVRSHPEFYVRDSQGRPQAVKGYTDIVQFDYSRPEVRAWMTAALVRWVRDFDVDGFRCDMAWNIPWDYWQEARAALEAVKPVFLLAEANDPNTLGSFDSDYDWNLMPPSPQCDLMRVAHGKLPPSVLSAALAKELAYAVPPDFFRLRFTSNHDEFNDVGTPGQTLGPAALPLAVLSATLPGKPLLYNGQELGWEGKYPGTRTAWNQPPDPVLDFTGSTRAAWTTGFYSRLLHLHQAIPQDRSEILEVLSDPSDCSIYAYLRRMRSDKVLVVLNLSDHPAAFDLEHADLAGDYRELFSNASVRLDQGVSGTAAAWEYRVYVSGPDAAPLLDTLALQGPLAPSWDLSSATTSPRPCPTPVDYPTPESSRVPARTLCGADGPSPESPGQDVLRLAQGINPDGVRARFFTSWSAQSLRVRAEVQDAAAFANLPSPWEDCSVEVYLNTSDAHAGDYGPGDFQYIFTVGRSAPFEASQRVTGVTCSSTRTARTWTVSASIPWTTLGVSPTAGALIGFDLAVDFNQDGSGRQGQLVWHGTADDYRNTRDFSDLLLLPCAVPGR